MKVNNLDRNGQERMIRNGWKIRLADSCRETPEQMYDRLSKDYTQVKVYWTGTQIRGIHSYYAMVK